MKSHSLDICLPLPSKAHMPKGKALPLFLPPCCSPVQFKVKWNAWLNYLLDILFAGSWLRNIRMWPKERAKKEKRQKGWRKDVSSCSCQITKSFLTYKLVALPLWNFLFGHKIFCNQIFFPIWNFCYDYYINEFNFSFKFNYMLE